MNRPIGQKSTPSLSSSRVGRRRSVRSSNFARDHDRASTRLSEGPRNSKPVRSAEEEEECGGRRFRTCPRLNSCAARVDSRSSSRREIILWARRPPVGAPPRPFFYSPPKHNRDRRSRPPFFVHFLGFRGAVALYARPPRLPALAHFSRGRRRRPAVIHFIDTLPPEKGRGSRKVDQQNCRPSDPAAAFLFPSTSRPRDARPPLTPIQSIPPPNRPRPIDRSQSIHRP